MTNHGDSYTRALCQDMMRDVDAAQATERLLRDEVLELRTQLEAIRQALRAYKDSDLASLARACADGCYGHDETRRLLEIAWALRNPELPLPQDLQDRMHASIGGGADTEGD